MTLPEQVTFGLACLGSVLGLLSFWRDWQRDLVRLKVIPKAWFNDRGGSGLCLEVVNLGSQAVTVTQVGLTAVGGQILVLPALRMADAERLPHRLEPRASFTVYWPPGADQDRTLLRARKAFAQTACGHTFTGTSPALKARLAQLAAAALAIPPGR